MPAGTAPAPATTAYSPLAARADAPGTGHAWWLRPAVILVVAALLRLVMLFTLEGDMHDGISRVGVSASWLFDGQPIFGRTVWPEGNYLLPALGLAVWNEPYWSPRILFALVALSNVWLVMRVARAAGFDETSRAVAGWVVALMPFHLVLSVNSAMSEAPYVAFVLAAIWLVLRWREHPSFATAVAAGLMVSGATAFRFDGEVWGLPLAASFVLLRGGRRFTLDARTVRDLAGFGIAGLAFIVVLVLQWRQLYPGDTFHQLDVAKGNNLQFFGSGAHLRWPAWLYQSYAVGFWPASTFVLLTPVVAVLAWVGLGSVARRAPERPLPLLLGIVAILAFLAYNAWTHSILAQWRYTLVVVVLLAPFVVPGARALSRLWPRLSPRVLTGLALVGAVGLQAIIADAAFRDRGIVSRQLGFLSPVRPSQFATRSLLTWAETNTSAAAPLVLTPHVVESPYLAQHRAPLERSGRLVVQSYFTGVDLLVHTRPSLVDALTQKLQRAGYVAASTSTRELGLQDGLARELVQPTGTGDALAWNGVPLARVANFGNIVLYRVAR
jgi:hypothetical protein